MIDQVIRFQNDIVMCFNEKGEQMSQYQGRYEEVRAKILVHAPKSTKFFHGTWDRSTPEHLKKKYVEPLNAVSRKEW